MSKKYDLIFGAHFMKPSPVIDASTSTTIDHLYEYLNPHDFDCLVVLVPRTTAPPISVVKRILRVGQVQAIILGALLFVISRLLLRLRGSELDAFLYTIGLCLSQMTIRRPTSNGGTTAKAEVCRARIEYVWTCSLAVYSAFAMAWLTAVVNMKIVSNPVWQNIDTLAELGDAGISVYVSSLFHDVGYWWDNLR